MRFGGLPDPLVTAARLKKRRRWRRDEELPELPPGTVIAREPGRPHVGDAELASRVGVEVYDPGKGML